jgi:ribosome-binding factor A
VVFVLDRGLEKGNTVLGLLQRLETERRGREEPLAEAGEADPAPDTGSDADS